MAMNLETVLRIKAQVSGTGDIGKLNTGLKNAANSSGKAATNFGKLKTAAGGAVGALRGLVPVLGVAAMASFAKNSLDTADAMSKLSQRTGVAVPVLDQFRKVAELSDTSIESLGRAFPALATNMDTAAQKAKGPAFEAFNRLGVAIQNSDGSLRSVDDVMLDVADKFSSMADGAEKSALASDIFGTKLGSELIPLLNNGGDAVRNMGTALTQDFADGAADLNDRLENIQERFGDLGTQLIEALMPALEGLVGFLESAISAFTSLPQPVQTLVLALGGLTAVAAVFAPLVIAITSLGPAISGLLAIAGPALTGLVALLTGPVGIVIAIGAVLAAIYVFRDEIGAFFVTLGEAIVGFGETLYEIFVQPFIDAFQAVVSFVADSWVGELIEYIGGIFTWFQETAESLTELLLFPFRLAIELFMDAFVNPIVEMITGAKDQSGNAWAQLGELLEGPFNAVLDFINDKFVEPIKSAISNVVDKAKEVWSGLTEPFKGPFNAVLTFIKENFISPIKNAISGIVDAVSKTWDGLSDTFIGPLQATIDFIEKSWGALQEVLTAPFAAAAEAIKEVLNNVISGVERVINGAINAINQLIRAANNVAGAVGLPLIQQISSVELPRFADGGLVNGPTMAIVGEGGQPEYIIPQSKADGFAQNWMAGIRGPAAIPRFANGGMVGPANANVSIQTGPVTQMNGTNYVTTQEMSAAVQAGVKQTLDLIRRDGNTRASLGFA